MALDFPASPNINDTYTSGGVTWTWDGTTWKVLGRFQFTSSETDPIFSASPASNIHQHILQIGIHHMDGEIILLLDI